MREQQMDIGLLDAPRYTTAMAARLTHLTPARVRRWLRGYEFSYPAGSVGEIRTGRSAPIVRRSGADGSPYASFLDLVDLLFVKEFVEEGVSLQKVRKALAEAQSVVGGHHFSQRVFFTNGRSIYLQVKDTRTGADNLLQLLSGGQWTIAPVIQQIAKRVDFAEATGYAQRWFPPDGGRLVVVDPAVSFGKPTLVRRGIPTCNVYGLYLGEDQNVDRVCRWMGLRPKEVKAAVRFESLLAA